MNEMKLIMLEPTGQDAGVHVRHKVYNIIIVQSELPAHMAIK
jgi:hypothetical protein